MTHGGKRNGSGRKAGSASKKTREVADRASEEGITPLEVMLQAMRHYHAENNLDRACEIAKDAAPYMHPRLGSLQVAGDLTGRFLVQTVHGVEGGDILGLPASGSSN